MCVFVCEKESKRKDVEVEGTSSSNTSSIHMHKEECTVIINVMREHLL